MKRKLEKLLSFVPFLLLITGATAYAVVKMSKPKVAPSLPYTLVQQHMTASPGKAEGVDYIKVIRKNSQGSFIETRERNGKQFSLLFSHAGYLLAENKDGNKLEIFSKYDPQGGWTEEALSKDPKLRKYDPIQWIEGVKCYVIRSKESESTILDICLAPSIDQVLQMNYINKDAQITATLKTVSLVFSEPEERHFQQLPLNLPIVQSSFYEKMSKGN